MADLAQQAAADAATMLANARRALTQGDHRTQRGRLHKVINEYELSTLAVRARPVVAQTRTRVVGGTQLAAHSGKIRHRPEGCDWRS
jgi:hypothetical protein